MIVCIGMLHVRTYDISKHTHTSLLSHFRPDLLCVRLCECVWERGSLPFWLFQSSQISVGWPNTTYLSLSRSPLFGNMMWERSEGGMTERKREQCKKDLSKGRGVKSLLQAANKQRKRRVWEMREREGMSMGGGWDEEPERSCRCSRRPTAAERRSCHSRLCTPTNTSTPYTNQGLIPHPSAKTCDAASHTLPRAFWIQSRWQGTLNSYDSTGVDRMHRALCI